MPSRADTLKIARADTSLAGQHLFEAERRIQEGCARAVKPDVIVFRAVLVLEHTAQRLRKSFGLEKSDAD